MKRKKTKTIIFAPAWLRFIRDYPEKVGRITDAERKALRFLDGNDVNTDTTPSRKDN